MVVITGLIGYVAYNANSQRQKAATPTIQVTPALSNAERTQSSPGPTVQPTPKPSLQPTTKPDPYAGWKTYDFKGWFSFRYPADFHVSTEGGGDDLVAVTSYTFNPNGMPTDMHCVTHGYDVPPCDVKIELTHKTDGSFTSALFPENTQYKSTAQLIIASVKKD